MMKPFPRTSNASIDDKLAVFTDRARARQLNQTEADVDGDLRILEETVLRLSRAFPSTKLDEVTVRRMQGNLHARAQAHGRRPTDRWLSNQSRQRMVFAFTAVVAVVCLGVLAPALDGGSTSGTASALSPNQFALGASVLALAVLAGLFIRRRK